MVSRVENGHIYVIEAIGKEKGIKEREFTGSSRIRAIRRIINNDDYSSPFNSKSEFTNSLNLAYRKALTRNGLSPDYAPMLVAQDALETAWG
jgi:flagellum-specific peptidoglycan hydrolase FlgJ